MKIIQICCNIGCLFLLLLMTNCKVNRAYTNGQEGLETVYKPKQIKAEIDHFGSPGTGGIHGDVSYSPLKNVAVLYDIKTGGTQHMYNTLALGFYKAYYKPYQLRKHVASQPTIDIGRHFDLYGGMSYGYTKGSIIPESQFFFGLNETYELNFWTKRYFLQGGAHFKGKYLGFDFVLRKLWLDVDKIELFGLLPDSDISPEDDFRNSSILPYTEFCFKINFVEYYKPIYMGFSRRFGDETNFTAGAFSGTTVFLGANLDIHLLFRRSAKNAEVLDYIYEE